MVENYCATESDGGVYLHQYMPVRVDLQTGNARASTLTVQTDYPLDERIMITVSAGESQKPWSLYLRIPAWCEKASLKVNGAGIGDMLKPGEYVEINRTWSDGDSVELFLPMTPRIIEPDMRIDDIRGGLALEYGPFVYCIEEADNPGFDIDDVRIGPDAEPVPVRDKAYAGGVTLLKMPGKTVDFNNEISTLYTPVNDRKPVTREVNLIAVPYFTWANRGAGKMRVWIPQV